MSWNRYVASASTLGTSSGAPSAPGARDVLGDARAWLPQARWAQLQVRRRAVVGARAVPLEQVVEARAERMAVPEGPHDVKLPDTGGGARLGEPVMRPEV